jgi:excisionase family DNA binding protein
VRLLTLEQAATCLGAVTVRMLRTRIRRGQLPAVKAGRQYLVTADDVASLYTPVAKPRPQKGTRESDRARMERQLRAAGIATDG